MEPSFNWINAVDREENIDYSYELYYLQMAIYS